MPDFRKAEGPVKDLLDKVAQLGPLEPGAAYVLPPDNKNAPTPPQAPKP